MSELQAEAVDVADVETTEAIETETEQPTEVSESAPDTGENQEEKVKFSPEQQKHIDDIIGKKVFKAREAEREAEKLREQLKEYQSKVPAQTRPEIPPIPDPFSEDYEIQVKQRDEALRKAAEFDAQERLRQDAESAKQKEAEEAQLKAYKATVDAYTNRAKTLGMSDEELNSSVSRINQYGIRDDLASFIMGNDAGPLITKYLANNLLELDKLNSMESMQAAVYIETAVKSKAAALKQKTTVAPEPVETLKGAGVPSQRGPKNATYE